jgi:hypothetical protein
MPESSYFKIFWTPASAGVTTGGAFYGFINFEFCLLEFFCYWVLVFGAFQDWVLTGKEILYSKCALTLP